MAYLSLNPNFQQMNLNLKHKRKSVYIVSFRPKVLRRIHLNQNQNDNDDSNSVSVSVSSHSSLLFSVEIPPSSFYHWKKIKIQDSPEKEIKDSADHHDYDYDYDYDNFQLLGWEKNTKGKLAPRILSLATLLSPTHLASTAVNLNLSLMKWRQIPNLNTTLLSQTKCLLLGAGTLGCNVARTLLGWGVTHITFVDNGRVTYSNPARQSLFTIDDVHQEKASVAADYLKKIVPGVVSQGVTLSIPMPGHDMIHTAEYQTLKELIQECDVVYLLTDTRESRWLPTLMAKQMGKILINAALGSDTYLVMRHGMSIKHTTTNALLSSSSSFINDDLGCYFCNDVVAPENSTRERTLDQQCTVTRPGLAPIAGALAVEMMVALLPNRKI